MKINGTAIAAGVTIDLWKNRPGTGDVDELLYSPPSDGDFFQVSGSAVYRYSSTIGEWVRPFVYDGTPALDIRLRGSVLPQNESPAWILSASYQGGDVGRTDNVSTDGEYVTISHAGSNNEQNIHYSHGQVGKNHFFQGNCEYSTSGTRNRPDFLIKDGIKCCYLDLNNSVTRLHATQTTRTAGGLADMFQRVNINYFANYSGDSLLPEPRYLEVYMASTGSTKGLMVFVDHELHPSIVAEYQFLLNHNEPNSPTDFIIHSPHAPGFPVASSSIYFLGATESRGGSDQRYKECFWGRY